LNYAVNVGRTWGLLVIALTLGKAVNPESIRFK
jgi:hypothetical protein